MQVDIDSEIETTELEVRFLLRSLEGREKVFMGTYRKINGSIDRAEARRAYHLG